MKKKIKQKNEFNNINSDEKLTKEQIIVLEDIVFFNTFNKSLLKPFMLIDILICSSLIIPLILLLLKNNYILMFTIISLFYLTTILFMIFYNTKYIIKKNNDIEKEFDNTMNILNFNKDNMNDVTIECLKLLLIELKTLNLIQNNETNLTINEFKKLLKYKEKNYKKIKKIQIKKKV